MTKAKSFLRALLCLAILMPTVAWADVTTLASWTFDNAYDTSVDGKLYCKELLPNNISNNFGIIRK